MSGPPPIASTILSQVGVRLRRKVTGVPTAASAASRVAIVPRGRGRRGGRAGGGGGGRGSGPARRQGRGGAGLARAEARGGARCVPGVGAPRCTCPREGRAAGPSSPRPPPLAWGGGLRG